MRLLLGWAIIAGVLLLLPYLIPAVQIRGFGTALLVALVLGLLNAVVRPILVLLTLPISLLTLGLFVFVLNGLMFWLAARMLDGFTVDGVKRLEDKGVTDVIVGFRIPYIVGPDTEPLDNKIRNLEMFAENVVAKVS